MQRVAGCQDSTLAWQRPGRLPTAHLAAGVNGGAEARLLKLLARQRHGQQILPRQACIRGARPSEGDAWQRRECVGSPLCQLLPPPTHPPN